MALEEYKLDGDISVAADFVDKARVARIAAAHILAAAANTGGNGGPAATYFNNSSTPMETKLPKLQSATFSGNVTD